ncbi:hypothetical protein YPPY88_3816, partial [Yersinia pestis PY-88]
MLLEKLKESGLSVSPPLS